MLNSKNPIRRTMCAKLDESDRTCLIARAAQFGIFARIEQNNVHLLLPNQGLHLALPLEIGLSRLVAELAEVLTPWVIFSAGKPPERVLLKYTDVKYRKLIAAFEAARAAKAGAGTP